MAPGLHGRRVETQGVGYSDPEHCFQSDLAQVGLAPLSHAGRGWIPVGDSAGSCIGAEAVAAERRAGPGFERQLEGGRVEGLGTASLWCLRMGGQSWEDDDVGHNSAVHVYAAG